MLPRLGQAVEGMEHDHSVACQHADEGQLCRQSILPQHPVCAKSQRSGGTAEAEQHIVLFVGRRIGNDVKQLFMKQAQKGAQGQKICRRLDYQRRRLLHRCRQKLGQILGKEIDQHGIRPGQAHD